MNGKSRVVQKVFLRKGEKFKSLQKSIVREFTSLKSGDLEEANVQVGKILPFEDLEDEPFK